MAIKLIKNSINSINSNYVQFQSEVLLQEYYELTKTNPSVAWVHVSNAKQMTFSFSLSLGIFRRKLKTHFFLKHFFESYFF